MFTTELKRHYNPTFTVSEEYKNSLPDLQNGPASLIEGANVPIQQVGISNFKLPLKYINREGDVLTLETSVDGYVGLEADKKGINMSRIIRTFYDFKDDIFSLNKLEDVLRTYKKELDSQSACLRLSFSYPFLQESLRSGLEGYQYYDFSFEAVIDANDVVQKYIHYSFDYSSACPCSYELAEHARNTRDVAAIPHSQRSQADITIKLKREIQVEELIEIARDAIMTETQVMVKREDEQAFAELNAAYQKFVEDAARLFYQAYDAQEEVEDFVIHCAHFESLHSHDAVSRICKGIPGGLR